MDCIARDGRIVAGDQAQLPELDRGHRFAPDLGQRRRDIDPAAARLRSVRRRCGVTTPEEIKECNRHLESAEVVRVILNKLEDAGASYYYSYSAPPAPGSRSPGAADVLRKQRNGSAAASRKPPRFKRIARLLGRWASLKPPSSFSDPRRALIQSPEFWASAKLCLCLAMRFRKRSHHFTTNSFTLI